MIIAVDAGMLGVTDPRLKVGVWRVAVNLLSQLGRLDKANDYRLYSFAPIPKSLLSRFGPRMKNYVLSPGTGWMSVRLPLEFMLRTPDLFLGLAQALPPWGGKNIGFIYDLGFLSHPEAYPDSHVKLVAQTQKVVQRAQHIITISQSVKQDIQARYGVADKQLTVAYPGVSSEFLKPGPAYRTKRPYFLVAGSLKRGKNIPFAIRAFAQFLKRAPQEYQLIIAGSTFWLDPGIHKAIDALGIGRHVTIMGFVSDKKLSGLYRGATALLMPSLVEGFGLPAVESMACGTPVVAAAAGSLPEIVGNGGILVAPGDLEGFVDAMKRVRKTPTIRIQARTFRWEQFATDILRTFTL